MDDRQGMLEFTCSVERLPNGNTLIADAGAESGSGSEIIEVNPAGNVVWRSAHGYRFAHTARRLPNGNTVIADTSNNRILEVNPADEIVWSSDDWTGGTGKMSNGSPLHYPNNICMMDAGKMLVTNRNSNGFVIVDCAGNISLESQGELNHPHNCEPLPDGNFIVADSDEDRVRMISAAGETLWEYAAGLRWPRDANLLENGNVLIADSKNSRVLEVTRAGETVWEYQLPYFANIYEVQRLPNGNTLFSDQQHQRVVEVNPAGDEVWQFRNYRREKPVYEKVTNGFFKQRDENGFPADWTLATRLSEGGGKMIWGESAYGKPVPGLEYDRAGALCCQQSVKVDAGQSYRVGCRLKTEGINSGMGCIQVAFKDEFDGLLGDVTQAPKGELFAGDTDWTQDSFEITVPESAAFADIRIFINGAGKIFFNEIRMTPVV
ncbi:MAG: PQQ-binding-like beta-propeller repeat protein [Kiritimatiellales bacterium]